MSMTEMFNIGKVAFFPLLLLCVAGGVFLALNLKVNRRLKKGIKVCTLMAASLVCACALVLTWVWVDLYHISENKLAYKVSSSERQVEVKVKETKNDLDGELVYVIDSFWGTWQIPESVYQAYVGSENASVTLRFEKATIYVAESLSKENSDKAYTFSLYRISPPWENEAEAFSNEEMLAYKSFILKTGSVLNNVAWSDLSVDYDQYGCGRGKINEICLNDAVVRLGG